MIQTTFSNLSHLTNLTNIILLDLSLLNYDVYTDGACEGNQYRNNKGGWAAIIFPKHKPELMQKISGCKINTTNNRMELMACIQALEYLSDKQNSKVIEIYTDSAYVSNCFKQGWYLNWENNGWRNSKNQPVKNADLWKILIKLYNTLNVKFIHVKGHSGNKYNEMVDSLAVAAIDNC
ncbi:MAG: ribonuclease HI [Candidatus Lokiarchaeota archaeon]|nr:ribonuclease HI [Candidatus Lokiarchaeota archaeon]